MRRTSSALRAANSSAPHTRSTRPASMRTYLSAIPVNHDRRCSATSTAHPASFARATNPAMSATAGRSRLLVGSSNSRFAGRAAQRLANATFCRSPPERRKRSRPAKALMPSSSKVAPTRWRMSSGGQPAFSRANATSPVESALKNWVRGFWNSEPARWAISHVSRASTARPSRLTRPCAVPGKNRGAKPPARRSAVDLPHPERPHSTTTSPERTVSDTSTAPARPSSTCAR